MATAGAAEMEAELANFLSISRAFKLSKALGVACKLNLFTLLSQHPPGEVLSPGVSISVGWST